jgi:hypothetical protein
MSGTKDHRLSAGLSQMWSTCGRGFSAVGFSGQVRGALPAASAAPVDTPSVIEGARSEDGKGIWLVPSALCSVSATAWVVLWAAGSVRHSRVLSMGLLYGVRPGEE